MNRPLNEKFCALYLCRVVMSVSLPMTLEILGLCRLFVVGLKAFFNVKYSLSFVTVTEGTIACRHCYNYFFPFQDAVDNPRLNNGPQEKQRTLRQTTICQEKKGSPTMSSMWCCGSWISLWCEHMRSLQGKFFLVL